MSEVKPPTVVQMVAAGPVIERAESFRLESKDPEKVPQKKLSEGWSDPTSSERRASFVKGGFVRKTGRGN